MRHLPNFFTLLNLLFGCCAIVCVLQTGQSIVILNEQAGTYDPLFPERMAWGSLFLFAAAAVDFLDGFVARLLKAQSAMGAELDSLSDMVSFGVAPGLILYQLLRLGFAGQEDGLNMPVVALLPAFLFTAAVAWRLAKFNLSTTQKYHFEGVPSPAGGLVVASLPLIIWTEAFGLQGLFINPWLLYALIIILSYLMVSRHLFMAIKFTDYSVRNNLPKYILVVLGIIAAIWLKWLAVPVVFIVYVLVSIFTIKEPNLPPVVLEREEPDSTI